MTSRERAEAAIQIRREAGSMTTVCLVHPDGQRGDILWSYQHPEDATGTAEQYRGYLAAHLDAHAAEAVVDAVADAAGLAGRILRREPEADGTYAHLIECSGSRHHPPGTPGVCCCCLPGHAAAAVAAEREACVRVAEMWIDEGGRYRPYAKSNAFGIAAAIRARGKETP